MIKNFTNTEIQNLEEKYLNTCRYYCLSVLKHLGTVVSSNDGHLPNHFKIEIYLPDLDFIKEVLKDLGYPHVRNIICFGKTIYITIY